MAGLVSSGEWSSESRRTRMHKWANPLAWMIRAGIAIALGALATMSCGQCGVFHFGLGRTRLCSNEYYVNLSFYIITSVLPWVILMFPLASLRLSYSFVAPVLPA